MLLVLVQLTGVVMFLKISKSNNYEYAQIVESYRVGNTPKHKLIANLGRVDKLLDNGFLNIANKILDIIEDRNNINNQKKKQIELFSLNETGRASYGHLPFLKIWKKFKIDDILNESVRNSKIQYDFSATVFSMVINKLLKSSSKLALFNNKEEFAKLNDELKLQHLYKALDILALNKENIEKKLFQQRTNLFNSKLDIVFYDVTTFYFESQKSDELKDFGFGKDGKINDVQVVMGLLIDKEGMPVAYDLYQGNTADVSTLKKMIESLKKRFEIDNVVIVADKGINSKSNMHYMTFNSLDYIVSSRIKSLPKKIQEEILDLKDYKDTKTTSDDGHILLYKEIPYTNVYIEVKEDEKTGKKEKIRHELHERIICTYSSKRASKDAHDRNRQIEKAEKLIQSNSKSALETQKGYKRYIAKNHHGTETKGYDMELNTEKILDESKYDGFYAIQTSRKDLTAQEVIKNYHMLYRIEDSFRVLKSTMKARPVYHWTEQRIKGHFMMCFIAFLLERELENKMQDDDMQASPERIKAALNSMQTSEIQIAQEQEKFYMKGKNDSLGSKIFAKYRIKLPKNVSTKEEMDDYLKMK